MPERASILIVEDEEIVALDIQCQLERLGYRIAGMARSGEDACREAVNARPDLVLMDISIEGELDGVRILSPAMLKLARQVHTKDMPNQLYKRVAENAGWQVPPANQGIGFQVRGTGVFHHLFGTLASPETFGNYGAGSTLFWVDPERDVSFACLTAGVMTQADNIERFQKLSDLVLSAMV